MTNLLLCGGSFAMILLVLWIMHKTCSKASENAIKEAMEGNYEPMKDLQDQEGSLK